MRSVFAFIIPVLISCGQNKKIQIHVLDETSNQKLDKATVVNTNAGKKVEQSNDGLYILPIKETIWLVFIVPVMIQRNLKSWCLRRNISCH
jgi:hypothetical protein